MKKSGSLVFLVIGLLAGFGAGIFYSAAKLKGSEITPPPAAEAPHEDPRTAAGRSIADLKKMVSMAPDNMEALVKLGDAYMDSGDFANAVDSYQKALKTGPPNPDVVTDIGTCYRRLGKPDKAVESYQEALKIDPNHAMAMFNMGIVLRHDLKNPQAALKIWEQFLEKFGDTPHAVQMVRPWVNQLKEEVGLAAPGGK